MDGADPDRWSDAAADWADTWDGLAAQLWPTIERLTGLVATERMLDVGCGAGGVLARAAGRGIDVAGLDPAPGMVVVARDRVPGADLRIGGLPDLPWPDASFDATLTINAVLFAPDPDDAIVELMRVTRPGGRICVAWWADDLPSDTAALERAAGPVGDGGAERQAGDLEQMLTRAGCSDVRAAVVRTTWHARDDEVLVRGVLASGERTPEVIDRVLAAAEPLRTSEGYALVNHVHCCSGRV